VHLGPMELEVPLADEILISRSKHVVRMLREMINTGSIPPNGAKLVPLLLELLEKGTERGEPVAIAGASLTIDAPEIQAPPRRLEVGAAAMDNINWNQLVVGLDRYDARKKKAGMSGSRPASGRDMLMNRIMSAREQKGRVLYDNALRD